MGGEPAAVDVVEKVIRGPDGGVLSFQGEAGAGGVAGNSHVARVAASKNNYDKAETKVTIGSYENAIVPRVSYPRTLFRTSGSTPHLRLQPGTLHPRSRPAHADTTGNNDGTANTVSLPEPVAVTVQPNVSYNDMPNGIDIASWQHPNGANVDFKRVQAAGYTYVFVKATEGTHYKNEYYVNDAMAAQGNGVLMGGYHYADVSKDARTQAAMFADTISVKGGTSLPPVLDIEEAKGLNAAQLNLWVRAFLQETYNRVGLTPIIYSYRSFLMNQMGNTPTSPISPCGLPTITARKAPLCHSLADGRRGRSGSTPPTRRLTACRPRRWTPISLAEPSATACVRRHRSGSRRTKVAPRTALARYCIGALLC
ncbi:MAG: glycoside hydrolase family 25 protein [Lawsonella clevelandensis]